jgi:hypothetical protein
MRRGDPQQDERTHNVRRAAQLAGATTDRPRTQHAIESAVNVLKHERSLGTCYATTIQIATSTARSTDFRNRG